MLQRGAQEMDSYADLNKPLTIRPGKLFKRKPTGLYMEIPAGYEYRLRP